MKPQIKEFLKELTENNEFKEKFAKASSEEKDRLASFYLKGMNLDEFKKEILKIKKESESSSKSVKEKELVSVIGGGGVGKKIGKWLGKELDELLGIGEKDKKYYGFKDIAKNIGDITTDSICRFLKF